MDDSSDGEKRERKRNGVSTTADVTIEKNNTGIKALMKDPAEMQLIREQIFAISDKLKPLRKEYAMCKDIYDRSDDIAKTVERIEFPQLVEQERQKAALKKNGREER